MRSFKKSNLDSEKVGDFNDVVFDESSNLIYVVCEKSLIAFSLSLQIVASVEGLTETVTAVGVTDPSIWNKNPFFVTGNRCGKCCLWEVDVVSAEISKKWEIDSGLAKISVVEVFFRNKAVLLVDENSESVVISVSMLKSPFLSKNLFVNCCACNEKLEPKKTFICASCSLAVCAKCYNKKSGICTKCQPASNKSTDL